MSFCVEAAVDEVGGEEALEPGDIILYNDPYGTGSHPQDAAIVMPVFLPEGELVGYAAIKAHWLDIGGKELVLHRHHRRLPGGHDLPRRQAVPPRRARRGHLPKIAIANSRVPKMVPVTSTPRSSACAQAVANSSGWWSATDWRRSPTASSGCTTTARPSCAATSSSCRTAGTSAAARWTTTASGRRPIPFEVVARDRRHDVPARLLATPRRHGRADQLPAPVDRLRRAGHHDDARGRRGGAERGPLPADRGHRRARVRCSTHCSRQPCFLYGWPAMQATEAISTRSPTRHAGGGLRMLRRRPLRGSLVRRPGGHRRVLGATDRRTRSGRARRPTATARAPACTTSKQRRGSRRSRSGRPRTPG